FALPDARLDGGLVFVEQLDGVEVLVAPVEQLEAGFAAGGVAFGAHQYRDDTPAVAQGGGNQAIACRRGVAGFQAVDGGVGPKKPVAVGLPDVVIGEFFLAVVVQEFRKVGNQVCGQG